MSLIVQKFGGTSVATSERIQQVAARIASTHREGHRVIAVVSAMGAMTDELGELAHGISHDPPAREMDMLLTAGERISMALLAIALDAENVAALSLTGSQAGILTIGDHGSAEIQEVRSFRVDEGLEQDQVVIVAGFQGVDPATKDVTTLGRGGSDVTAVALAAAHGAEVCEFYKDVDGVFTADPEVVAEAKILRELSYQEMAALAAGGSQVLNGSAVEMASQSKVSVHIRSSFHEGEGTRLRAHTPGERLLCGLAAQADAARIVVREEGSAAVMGQLTATGLTPDALAGSEDAEVASLVLPEAQIKQAEAAITEGGTNVLLEVEPGFGKLSLVGEGAEENVDVAETAHRALAERGIRVVASGTAPFRRSFLLDGADLDEAAQVVHTSLDPPVQ